MSRAILDPGPAVDVLPVNAEEPDLSVMEYVKGWFGKHLPQLAGAVASVVVHPVVGKVVGAAGDLAAAEFRRRFGEQ